eukprot:1157340-Pelagomonas_calceolata.AAC.14
MGVRIEELASHSSYTVGLTLGTGVCRLQAACHRGPLPNRALASKLELPQPQQIPFKASKIAFTGLYLNLGPEDPILLMLQGAI